MGFVRIGLVALAALLWASSAAAAPSAPTDPTAREELKQGYQLAQDNKCSEAIPHLAESLRREPRSITLINLADCEEKVGKLADAMVHWADARTRAGADGEKAISDEAANRATALDARVPRVTIQLSKTAPPDTTVERDGIVLGAPSLGVPLPVDPGPHTVVVKAKGHDDMTKQITVAESERQVLDVTIGRVTGVTPTAPTPANATTAAPETKRSLSPLVPIGFGVGAAGLVVGTITGILTLGKGSDAKDHCGTTKVCDSPGAYNSVQSGKTLGAVSTVAFIAGGAGVAVGVVGLLTGKKEDAKVDVAVGPGHLLLRGTF